MKQCEKTNKIPARREFSSVGRSHQALRSRQTKVLSSSRFLKDVFKHTKNCFVLVFYTQLQLSRCLQRHFGKHPVCMTSLRKWPSTRLLCTPHTPPSKLFQLYWWLIVALKMSVVDNSNEKDPPPISFFLIENEKSHHKSYFKAVALLVWWVLFFLFSFLFLSNHWGSSCSGLYQVLAS